eukprot:CAMPEP_0117041258 /NCGR_PEP_ID=MMETSP0472-20121206/28830_1 /TAXON_ID=693140 ORGANISM="Tiarina fusus, Strain LIS" /NCGR_SAMPLE_ID=MMETSP0472 /ASSEMBLY_ACC=CAM_ASM_000603 /LENGTH=158 /DNA_ID=CAMNT_0004752231 /DNA_START=292 /DNA_END=765 /DNA_ORIENTATION=+
MAALIKKPPTLHDGNGRNRNGKSDDASSYSSSSGRNTNPKDDLRHASTETLLHTAAGVVQDICAASTIFHKTREDRYPQFHEREVVAGNVIGRGGFCVVRSVEKLKCNGVSTRRMSGNSSGGISGVGGIGIGIGASERSMPASGCLPWLCGGGGGGGG